MANVQDDRLICRLPDGGTVEVTNRRKVPMGDVRAYKQLTYTRDGGKGRPAVRAVFEVVNAVPVCTTFHLSSADQIPVRARDLRSVKLDELRSMVYAYAGVFVKDGNWWVLSVGHQVESTEAVQQATRRRRNDDGLLAKVAKIYNSAPEGSSMEAVASAFQVSERQAWRYIAQARENGLIK